MDAQRENTHTIRRPESPGTVRRQQKELRRIRQRARRNSMTEEQIEQRRERGREYYIRKKNQQLMKESEQKDVTVDQILQEVENDMLNPCTTAEQIKQLRVRDHAYQIQQKNNLEVQQQMKQTEEKSMSMDQQGIEHVVQSNETNIIFRNKRLTHVKRQARTLDSQMVSRSKDVHSPRIIHIRRQARMLNKEVVDSRNKNGVQFHKRGSFFDNNGSVSLVQEHAQILIDISRMNGHTSTATVGISGGSVEIDINKGDVENYLAPYDVEGSSSDSEEVLAFLMDLSAKKG